jgi:hypothetical protein
MYILTGNKPNIKILMTYDVHRPNQIFFLKNYIQFKKNFINYPFFAELIGEKGTEYNTDKWTKTNKINEPIESNLKLLYLQHDGVIGYELPRNLIYFLSQNNIPYINYHNSVYRCGSRYHYALETSMNLSNPYYPRKPECIKPNIKIGTLLVGQMKYDRSVLKEDKFISLIDFEDIIENLPKPIYFSPHPNGNEELLLWAKIKGYEIVKYSTYELFESKPELICGVSSSALYEARDIWKLPVLFLYENESIRNNIHLPYDIAFDPELINSILEQNEIKTKIFLGKNYSKYLSSQNS